MRNDVMVIGAIVVSCVFSFVLVWLASRGGMK